MDGFHTTRTLAAPLEHSSTFAVRNLSVLQFAAGYTGRHYRARGLTLAKVLRPGFFNPAADLFARGDTILVSAEDAGALLYVVAVDNAPGGRVIVRLMASSEPV